MLSVFRRQCFRRMSVVTGIAGYSKDNTKKLGMLVLGKDEIGSNYGNIGEDAFFINKTNGPRDTYGVADGVGGWRSKGIDPSVFSGTLMLICKEESMKIENPKEVIVRSMEIMTAVHESGDRNLLGSSTVITVAVQKDEQRVQIANLGDSGFIHIQNGKVKTQSKDQTHYFNCPYQLSVKIKEHRSISDDPNDADEYELQVEPNDILITATDGLLDNVPQDMICGIFEGVDETTLEEKLEELCHLTLTISFDPNYMSPFAIEARKQGYENEKGGKLDDLTIIVNLFK